MAAHSGYPERGQQPPANTELRIRPVQREDLQVLLDLYSHLDAQDQRCSADEAIAVLERFLRYPGSEILIGLFDTKLVTSCTLVVIPNLTRGGRPYALIENVVTHAEYRGRGLGKTMLKEAVRRAWVQDCYKAMLMTGSKKPSTLAFYEAVGFEQTKTGFQIRRLATSTN
jgi:GNAT superfamily N-acetyltransferase